MELVRIRNPLHLRQAISAIRRYTSGRRDSLGQWEVHMETSLLKNMQRTGKDIASAFSGEVGPDAAMRITGRLLSLMKATSSVDNEMGSRLMILGALSALGQEEVAEQVLNQIPLDDALRGHGSNEQPG